MKRFYIDIETLPTDNVAVKKQLLDSLKPPGNMKKPETIQAWLDDPANLSSAVHKTGLSGLHGQIACLGIAQDTGDVEILSGTEQEILRDFLCLVRQQRPDGRHDQSTLIGHNIINFDAPFINQRMLVHGMGPLFPFGTKPWDAPMDDTMTMFGANNRDYIKLVDLCLSLGVDKPLDEIDGSEVADAWKNGHYEKVFQHCESDIIATRACYQHMVQPTSKKKTEAA